MGGPGHPVAEALHEGDSIGPWTVCRSEMIRRRYFARDDADAACVALDSVVADGPSEGKQGGLVAGLWSNA